MDAASIFLGRELVKRAAAKREAYLKPLIDGAAKDFADYKFKAGYLKGLEDCLQWIDDINLGEPSHARDDATRP